ncbi:class I SAM-dependent methyltransferase [Egicoccus halophilus]|uniref:class I SAM-dependent methyltransferase n=1 Tax=Egicoccus halophilus TaxID=1670830 RepID=UPI0013EE5280|nr:class I SAM-dependent methyltransferase [Egicoccus halophilus]
MSAPPVPATDAPAFYREIGDFQGAEYRRNAFAAGTEEEVAALVGLTGLTDGDRVLDVGCGDGRHLRALATRGIGGTGVDVSPGLIAAATAATAAVGPAAVHDERTSARIARLDWRVGDARSLATVLGADLGAYDVAWSLCHGALGTSPASDPRVIAGLAAAVRPGGLVVATFFSALFAARHLAPGDAFDPVSLVHHQLAEVRGPDHVRATYSLWTASYTVREACRLLTDAGLEVLQVRGVEPGAYGRRSAGEVALDDPEMLVLARR